MKAIYLLPLLTLFAGTVVAQKTSNDFVITSSGDTLRGQTVFSKRLQQIQLRQPNQPVQTFSASQAAAYGDETGPIRVSKRVDHQASPKFLTPLLNGPVSLYSGENAEGELRFFLQPQDSAHVIEIQPRTPRLAYLRVMPGCEKLDFSNFGIESLYRYNTGSLQQLVQTYNTCRYPQEASSAPVTLGGYRTHFGVKAGANATRFTEKSVTLGKPQSILSYQAGIFLSVNSKRVWGLQTEVTYARIKSGYEPVNVYNGYATYTTTRAVEIDYSQIQIPFLLRYTLPGINWRPYVNAGPTYSFNFNRKSAEVFQDSDKTSPLRKPLNTPITNNTGAAAGIGLLLPQSKLSVEGRVDYTFEPTRVALRLDVGLAF
jgi:Outer membrane protein beta-barrel domain